MAANPNNPEMIPIEQVAQELGTTVLSVLMHIKRNLLVGHEVDGAWLVTTESLARLALDGHGRQAATLCRSSCSKAGGCGSCQ